MAKTLQDLRNTSQHRLSEYVQLFNHGDNEIYSQYIRNDSAETFLKENIPLFACPDQWLERTYFFRWWTLRKHIKQTPDGFVFTEFLPAVNWAGKHNTINCAAELHVAEARWLANSKFVDDYIRFWYRGGGTITGPRSYTNWLPHSVVDFESVTGTDSLSKDLLNDLVKIYRAMDTGWDHQLGRVGLGQLGIYLGVDDREGSEMSISGQGYRVLTNSAMLGQALAIAKIADKQGENDLKEEFNRRAEQLSRGMKDSLWNKSLSFFVTRKENGTLADVRELWGYMPWYFGFSDPAIDPDLSHLLDPAGFLAPFGPSFAEQRHPAFKISYGGHECQWNGPSWPMATSMVLTTLINLFNCNYRQTETQNLFAYLLSTYSRSHQLIHEDGKVVSWIDENLNPFTGDWISRTRLKSWNNGTWDDSKGGVERGKDYNHSTFCDLIITGLIGLQPNTGGHLTINPMLPQNHWPWFALIDIPYHGRKISIIWDADGKHFDIGSGLSVFVDDECVKNIDRIGRVEIDP